MTPLDQLKEKLEEWKVDARQASAKASRMGSAYHRGEEFAYKRVAEWVDMFERFEEVAARR